MVDKVTKKRPIICLTMIVKNEAKIIGRCLKAVRNLIDHWIIVDTGSTDNTQNEILEALEGVPGMLHFEDWKGFGPAKTTALERAREAVGENAYALMLDADELIQGKLPDILTADAYGIVMQLNNVQYKNVRIFNLARKWSYTGVIHEFPTCDGGHWTDVYLQDVFITSPRDGARSNNPNKYQEDADLLEKTILEMKDCGLVHKDYPLLTRYVFYLAQSYRDAGDDQKAFINYVKRSEMGGGSNWEEIYVSLLNAGRCMERMGAIREAEKLYLKAYHTWPDRVEALRELNRLLRRSLMESEHKQPIGQLFVET